MKTHKNKAKPDTELKARELLHKYQTLCESRRKADEEVKTFFDITRKARGNWQEAVRKKNEADKALMEFHIGLKDGNIK